MRFMIMGYATTDTEAGMLPTGDELAAMGKYHQELVEAGVLVDAVGLRPTSLGARVRFGPAGKRPVVVDGPFTESKELIAGFSIIQVGSKAEAIEWAARAPMPEGTVMEIRQVFEDDDFASSDPTGELRAQDARMREKMVRKA